MRVVVVGSGVSGLVTALLASREHEVVLITKTELAESNTRYAQGGIAAAMFEGDSVRLHIEDTLRAGAGLCSRSAVEVLCTEGPEAIRALLAWGVGFDRDADGLAYGLEAAHSHARILHAGGDATGAAIEHALVAAVRRADIEVREGVLLTDLVVRDGAVVGIETLDGPVLADAVVLATGGAGQVFAHTSNPLVATGDGLAAALRAGAETADLEFYQFHPTTLALPGNFLVSEAVRGEGAVLRDAQGERFMLAVHPDAELAPRDVVARAIAAVMQRQNGLPVHLDARAIDAATLERRFPTISAACRANGLSLADDLIPVTPAAHYWMGGIATDLDGRSSLPGLYAVGEVACTGVHGANRLASNSLLEGVVFARRVADALGTPWTADVPAAPADTRIRPVALDRAALQELMWSHAGLVRDGEALATAAATLDAWAAGPSAALDRRSVENTDLLTIARAIVAAASAREESRGAHYRTDFPETQALSYRVTGTRKVAVPC